MPTDGMALPPLPPIPPTVKQFTKGLGAEVKKLQAIADELKQTEKALQTARENKAPKAEITRLERRAKQQQAKLETASQAIEQRAGDIEGKMETWGEDMEAWGEAFEAQFGAQMEAWEKQTEQRMEQWQQSDDFAQWESSIEAWAESLADNLDVELDIDIEP